MIVAVQVNRAEILVNRCNGLVDLFDYNDFGIFHFAQMNGKVHQRIFENLSGAQLRLG